MTIREYVRAELKELRRESVNSNPSTESAALARIHRLEQLSRSPWLFMFMEYRLGAVSGIAEAKSGEVLAVARSVARKYGLIELHPRLAKISTKDARQAWIGHAFVQSGYDVLLSRLAGSHGSLRSTRHYLRSLRYRLHSEVEIRKLQAAIFTEIESGRVLDPSRLRLLVANGKITPEQEARLADLQQRTRLGTGCLDPYSPPKSIDPEHRKGMLCRVQRCTGCAHGIVFTDSVSPLARRFAELLRLRRSIPMTSWMDTSLSDELDSIEQTLKNFDAQIVATEVAAWSSKLESGEIRVHDSYPSY